MMTTLIMILVTDIPDNSTIIIILLIVIAASIGVPDGGNSSTPVRPTRNIHKCSQIDYTQSAQPAGFIQPIPLP